MNKTIGKSILLFDFDSEIKNEEYDCIESLEKMTDSTPTVFYFYTSASCRLSYAI
jgi:hypothetical protein